MKFIIRIPIDLSRLGVQYPIKTDDESVDRILIFLSYKARVLLNTYRPAYSFGLLKELTGVEVPYYVYYTDIASVSGRKLMVHNFIEFGSTVIHPDSKEILVEVVYGEPTAYTFPIDIDVDYVECDFIPSECKTLICFGVGNKNNEQDRLKSRFIVHGLDYKFGHNVKNLKDTVDMVRQAYPSNIEDV